MCLDIILTITILLSLTQMEKETYLSWCFSPR